MSELEQHFKPFFENTIGYNEVIDTPYGQKSLVYADWAASGRLYKPIEDRLVEDFGPMVANTHTESNATGEFMTNAYHEARHIIKEHIGATEQDALIPAGSGMTSAVALLQRLLDLHNPEKEPPVVFVSEMEHHSNQTTWEKTIADVVIVPSNEHEALDMAAFGKMLDDYKDRTTKVAAITAASNVTGVRLPVHDIAKLVHQKGGLCFVDYTCAAPYDEITMRPEDPLEKLDAIYFSPHKFLGGPGTPGILVMDKALYNRPVPDRPGGGTVTWTNRWGECAFYKDVETREDGGTPPFLGLSRAALAFVLKQDMNPRYIAAREREQRDQIYDELGDVSGVTLLDSKRKDRLPVFSFTIDGLPYNFVTRLLNDKFGIQARGGCACAGTYGHCLFGISREESKKITTSIDHGDLSDKPGFVRLSIHPTISTETIHYITQAVKHAARKGRKSLPDYAYNRETNEYTHKSNSVPKPNMKTLFTLKHS